jgi:putative copper resistance protein D
MNFRKPPARARLAAAAAIFTLLFFGSAQHALGHDHAMPAGSSGHESMDMSMGDQTPMDATQQSKLLADKRESEFNHHLAGFFVILAGLFVLADGTLPQRWSFLRFAWPTCFLLSGIFLLVFSDTELWPFGPQSWWYGLTHNAEDLQHKTFAVILLALGVLEFQRARGVLKAAWSGWLFPLLACCGSVMLLFHEHHTGMHGPDHMTKMATIKAEHFHFAAAGFGIGIFKGLSELPTRWQVIFGKLWSVLMVVLGVLLLLYHE